MRRSSKLFNQISLFKQIETSLFKDLVQFSTSANELNLPALAVSKGCPFHHEHHQEFSSFNASPDRPLPAQCPSRNSSTLSSDHHSSASFSSTSFNSTLSSIDSNRSPDRASFVDQIKQLFRWKSAQTEDCQRLSDYLRIPKTATAFPTLTSILRLSLNGGVSYLHKHCDKLHEQHGPIYREKLGPVEGVFIADDDLIKEVFGQEDTSPTHLIPEPWIIYNQINNVQRGLFFL